MGSKNIFMHLEVDAMADDSSNMMMAEEGQKDSYNDSGLTRKNNGISQRIEAALPFRKVTRT